MLKKTISLILCIGMLCSMLPAPALASTLSAEEIAATEVLPVDSIPETEQPAETESIPEETVSVTEVILEDDGVLSEQYIQQCYESSNLSGFDLDAHVVLENDYTVPDDKMFSISEDASITVPAGKTLTLGNGATIYGSILVESGGTLRSRFELDIHGSVIVESGAVVEASWFNYVREGGLLWVKEGGRFTMTDSVCDISCFPGGSVTMDGTFEYKGSCPVDTYYEDGVYGAVNGVPVANQMLICEAGDTEEFHTSISLINNSAYRDYCIQVQGPVSLSMDTTIPDGCEVNFWSDASLNIQSGCTLVNRGDICSLDQPLQNNGTLENYGSLDICEGIVNNGTMILYEGVLTIRSNTYMTNNGTVYAYGNTVLEREGTWTGNEPILRAQNEEYLRQLISSGENRPSMDSDVVLENNFTISGDFTVMNVNATLTVPAGKTLTIQSNSLFVNNGGAIVVEEGGTLILNEGYLSCWNGSRVINRGSIYGTGYIIAQYENGQYVTEVQGIPYDLLRLRCMVNNDADLQEAVRVMGDTDYVYYILLVHGDIDLSADVTIPENAKLALLDTRSTMVIPAGKTLINNGSVEIAEVQTLHNMGTVVNNGHFGSRGTVINDGVFHAGTSLVDQGIWQGDPPIRASMTQEQLEKAMEEAGRYYQLNTDVTLERDLTVRGTLNIGSSGHLIVPRGIRLIVEPDCYVSVEPGGQLDILGSYVLKENADGWTSAIGLNTYNGNVGTVRGVKTEDLQVSGYVRDAANFSGVMQTVAAYPDSHYTFLYLYTDVELPADAAIPENCISHLYEGADLTVPSGKTLTNLGEVYCWQGQSIRNSGTIENQSLILVQGAVENRGQMNLRPGSVLVVDDPGSVNNTGSVDAYALDIADLFGSWTGDPIRYHCINQAEFETMLSSGGTVTLEQSVTLEKNLTIPENVELNISGGNIVVPEGVVLTVNTGVTLYKGGILVSEGGRLDLNAMIFLHHEGVLRVDGTFRSDGEGMEVVRFFDNGLTKCTVTGVPEANQRLYVVLRDQSQYWTSGIEVFESDAYRNFGRVFLDIVSDVTLPRDLTIPENGILIIEGMAKNVTVPQGINLTNHGVLRIDEAKSLYNYGTIENHGYFYIRANLFNYGTVEMLPAEAGSSWESLMDMVQYGYVENNGEVTFHTGSRLVQHETSLWTGNAPVWEYITQDQLEAELAAAAERGETYTLNTGVTLERNLTLDAPMIIGSGGSMLVPEGVTLNLKALLNVNAGGRLEVQGKYTVSDDGQVGVRYENGHFSSHAIGIQNKHLWVNMLVLKDADLRDGIALMEKGGYGLCSLAIYESFALAADVTIPANTLVPIENGADLTIPAGCTLTNNGEIYIWPGQTLHNNGVIRNNNLLRVGDGTLINNGTLELTSAEKQDARNPRLIINPGIVENNGAVTMAKNSYIEVFGTWYGNVPRNNGGRILPQAQSLTIEEGEEQLVDLRQTGGIVLHVTQPGSVFRDVTWTSSDPDVVDAAQITHQGGGAYYVPIRNVGKTKLTATSIDGANRTDSVVLEAERADWSPRLASKTLTLNPQLCSGVQVVLVPVCGNEILSCKLKDTRFTLDYDAENTLLTVNTVAEMKNGTVSTELNVSCADGETYSYPVKITVKNKTPEVTAKQAGKFDLFYTDSEAVLKVTAKNAVVEGLELKDTEDFCLEEGVLRFSDDFVADCLENPQLKPDTKATLYVELEGYRFPVTKSITIGTTTSKVSLLTNPTASTVHSALSDRMTATVSIRGKTAKEDLILESHHIQRVDGSFVRRWQVEEGKLSLDISGEKGGTAGIYVRLDNWMKPVKVSHKITVNSKLPIVKAAFSTLKLSTAFPNQSAETAVTLSHRNLEIAFFENFVSTAKEGSASWQEAAKLELIYDGNNIVARILDPENTPKAGTYTFKAVPVVADTALKAVTVKVNVSSALPKVKLGSSKLKLNTNLSGTETGTIPVDMTNSLGYDLQLTGFEGMDAYSQIHMELVDNTLQIRLESQRVGTYPFSLIPVVTDSTGTTAKLSPVKLNVQAYQTDVTVAQSGKGSLDAIDRSSKILYTVGKVTNALGTVEAVELASGSRWFDITPLETDAKGKQTFALFLKEDAAVSLKETYQVQFRYRICGRSVLSKPIGLKVKQSALKVSAPSVNYYLSQQTPLNVTLKPTSPAGASIAQVSIHPSKTSKALLDAIGSVDLVWGKDVVMKLQIRNPGNLVKGKSYKLVLDVTPAGHAAGAKMTQVTVTVKVAK